MACIAEALHSDAERQAAIALQKLLDYLDGKGLREIHFPALLLYVCIARRDAIAQWLMYLRCTARLLITELDRNELKPEIVAVARDALDTGQLTVPELEWFSRNSYNLALQYCTTWEPQYILRLLNACIQIINLYPENLGEEARKDIELRNMLCHFLAAIITVAQARTQNDPETKKGFYRDARMHIQGFRERVLPLMEQSLEEKTLEDCLKKYRTLLAFDFEAAVRLNQWDSLGEILHQSQTIADSALYSLYADALLCSGAPTEKLLKIFQIITQATHQRNLQNLEKTSRWIRCLFQFAIGSDIQIAESVLDQAYVLARDGGAESHRQDQNSVRPQGRQSPIKTAYPEEELEWLSTTAFNQAIDFYLASDDGASRRWYGKALDLARLLSDNGSLWHTLQEKYERLSWDD
ncbi:sporulation-specific protein 22 [Emydomyces testavorans]|uniref:Sporulation-specific protein 22 n=1 Tax=Emydomyces testavorans TaxID=2070801 RepID=A0AAF0DEP3_9EURO|nr:sporulation-specific protein 22 [Emydomyces testavorans]